MSRDGYLPPGCTQRMCDEAQPGYWDVPEYEQIECECLNGTCGCLPGYCVVADMVIDRTT